MTRTVSHVGGVVSTPGLTGGYKMAAKKKTAKKKTAKKKTAKKTAKKTTRKKK
jgi:hypothetical protein